MTTLTEMGFFPWVVFNAFVVVMLFVDLFVVNRRAHAVSAKEAAVWTAAWIAAAGAFNVFVYWSSGAEKALEFLGGYVVEKTLSIDNMFVFLVIFSSLNIPAHHQPRILKWGIIGALVMRAVLIFGGASLLNTFHWMIYAFGGLLLLTGARLLRQIDGKVDPERNLGVRLLRRLMPVSTSLDGQGFFLLRKGVRYASPLFVALLVIETTDLIFAIDSIPAIFAITNDVFIVYTSNIFAMLGLRALYFLIAGFLERFRYLKIGLSVALFFVGIKMATSDLYEIPVTVSVAAVFGILGASILYSVLRTTKTTERN